MPAPVLYLDEDGDSKKQGQAPLTFLTHPRPLPSPWHRVTVPALNASHSTAECDLHDSRQGHGESVFMGADHSPSGSQPAPARPGTPDHFLDLLSFPGNDRLTSALHQLVQKV